MIGSVHVISFPVPNDLDVVLANVPEPFWTIALRELIIRLLLVMKTARLPSWVGVLIVGSDVATRIDFGRKKARVVPNNLNDLFTVQFVVRNCVKNVDIEAIRG